MMSKKLTVVTTIALASAALICCRLTSAQVAGKDQLNIVTGISKPSVHAKLGLNQLGIVRDLPVEEGQIVKKGDLLLQQDDRQEVATLEAMKLEANSDVRVIASQADWKAKQIEETRWHELQKKNAATPSEVEEAEVKTIYADAQVKIAQLELAQNKLKAKGQQVKVDQMKLLSPVDGIVETIDVSVGEVTDPQKPVMTVVQNDPLWVEFYLPTAQSLKLKVGQPLDVRYDGEQQWVAAKLIYRAPVAEASAGMQKLRLELKNPNNKDTGLQMQVKLPPELDPALGSTGAPSAAVTPAP